VSEYTEADVARLEAALATADQKIEAHCAAYRALQAELAAVRVCFAEAQQLAGPAFVAHEELARLRGLVAEHNRSFDGHVYVPSDEYHAAGLREEKLKADLQAVYDLQRSTNRALIGKSFELLQAQLALAIFPRLLQIGAKLDARAGAAGLAEQAEAEVARLKAAGWKKEDFAAALKAELNTEAQP
jgi:hypothetical protein